MKHLICWSALLAVCMCGNGIAHPTIFTAPPGKSTSGSAKSVVLIRAEHGDPHAQFAVGLMYVSGHGMSRNPHKGFAWIRASAEQGFVGAQVSLGEMYAHGTGVKNNSKLAAVWYREAAKRGDVIAQIVLRRMHIRGEGVVPTNSTVDVVINIMALGYSYQDCQNTKDDVLPKLLQTKYFRGGLFGGSFSRATFGMYWEYGKMYLKDHEIPIGAGEAVAWFRLRADKGGNTAQCVLGEMYQRGLLNDPSKSNESTTEVNDSKAEHWYLLSAKQGNPAAQYNLGMIYDDRYCGDGKPHHAKSRLCEKAFNFVLLSARQGYADAQSAIGDAYYIGDFGIAPDISKAEKWYKLAAKQGDADAQNTLGGIYGDSEGLPSVYDCPEAVTWYRLAAENGNSEAPYSLGNIYKAGQCVPKDYAEAVKWYRMAAEGGEFDSLAQESLGEMYEKGEGVPRDVVVAYALYNTATPTDSSSAFMRDALAKHMSARQINDAQALTRQMVAEGVGEALDDYRSKQHGK